MARNFLGGKDIAIVAYGETKIECASGNTAYELAAAVAAELFAKTGLVPKDIDGLLLGKSLSEAPNTFYCNFMADDLGITPRRSQGMRLKVAFEKIAPEMNYFAFEPAG
jgi:hypothetical protein